MDQRVQSLMFLMMMMMIMCLYLAQACKRCRTLGSMFLKAKVLENTGVNGFISLVANTRLGLAP